MRLPSWRCVSSGPASLLPPMNLPHSLQNLLCGSLANVQLETDECLQQKQEQGGTDPDPMLELAAMADELDLLCHGAAEELSTSVIHSLEFAQSDDSTMVSCSLPPSANLRKLYLNMLNNKDGRILETLATPLKERLLQHSSGAVLMEGSRAPIRISQGWTSTHDCMVVEKEAFCIGRHAMCDVQLLDQQDLQSSRIHLCIFNLPKCILVVDGWSVTGTSVQFQGEKQTFCNHATGSLLLVPHGIPARLQVGSQCLLINPAEDGKSSPNDCAHGSVPKRLPYGKCTAAGPCCASWQQYPGMPNSRRAFLAKFLLSLEQDAAQQ